MFGRAEDYIDNYRKGKLCSTSFLFAYFLFENGGLITDALWDTVTFLKVAARNDLNTLKNVPSREGADLLGKTFIDEFSLELPLEWLVNNIPGSDSLLNNSDPLATPEYKDFMPINRAGQFYHAWNIMAWNACMSPLLVEQFTKALYIHGKLGGFDMRPTNGIVKVESDTRVSQFSGKISSILSKYS